MNAETTQQMAQLANSFCALVERFDDCQLETWLEEMADLLPRLHTAVSGLGGSESMSVYEQNTDYDARFDLFTRLYSVLGERNGYNYEYDGLDGQRLSGTLADDITDIYFDLKHGLSMLENNPTQAARDWQHSYEFHWRHHLVDAERQLGQIETQVSH
ncbi:MAG: DUF5063 domain-containing protein [Sulfuriflexus sp.]|nr:DUF5063 domain-containing protein [Sulfuriflexus sp.]